MRRARKYAILERYKFAFQQRQMIPCILPRQHVTSSTAAGVLGDIATERAWQCADKCHSYAYAHMDFGDKNP